MHTVKSILGELKRRGSKKNVAGMARYAIVARKVFGVSVGDLRDMGKEIGKDHSLAAALWKSGWYEARMLCAFVDDPKRVTPKQMDSWAKDFDNWAICDSTCFHLFDKTPHAWAKINAWAKRKEEFVRRGAFALLASVALHDKKAPDAPFVKAFALIETYATDDRNFVKKAVSWGPARHRQAQEFGANGQGLRGRPPARQIRRLNSALDRQGRPSRSGTVNYNYN